MRGRQTGGEALADGLLRWNVDTVFGLPGVHLDHFFDALYGRRDRIRLYHTRHEQGAAYMAFGYAAATGRPGVFTVVPGPGLLNSGAALATAYACSAPVLCLTTTVSWPMVDRHYGALHEIPNQSGLLRGLTKWSARVEHAAAVPEYLDEAFRQMTGGRPRPVALELPPEVLGQVAPMPDGRSEAVASPAPDEDLIEEAAKRLAHAKSPIIVVGGGAQHAGEAVRRLAETVQAPVISRLMGRGILSSRHDLSLPACAAGDAWKNADVVVGIGTRLQQLREWGADDELAVVRIDLDPAEMHRVKAPTVGIVADAADATAALADRLRGIKVTVRSNYAAVKAAFREEIAETLAPQMAWLEALRAAMPDDGVIVEDLTQVSYGARVDFPVYTPRSYLSSGYQGTLGCGFATALGAQAALPGRKVVAICGDGGFMYNVQELATAAQHGLGVVALVFNDGYFGNVHVIQKRWYGERYIGATLENPDFCALAHSFGVHAERITEPRELPDALERAFASAAAAVIEIPFDIDDMPWVWDYLIPHRLRP
jgi:acetolactate synthase-1/2/3 large subunit